MEEVVLAPGGGLPFAHLVVGAEDAEHPVVVPVHLGELGVGGLPSCLLQSNTLIRLGSAARECRVGG